VKPGVHRLTHSYRLPGRYRVTIVVIDKTGNRRTVIKRLKIVKSGRKRG
jgi:hypothetical protein